MDVVANTHQSFPSLSRWLPFTRQRKSSMSKEKSSERPALSSASSGNGSEMKPIPKWSMGVLNDKWTDEVPGMAAPSGCDMCHCDEKWS